VMICSCPFLRLYLPVHNAALSLLFSLKKTGYYFAYHLVLFQAGKVECNLAFCSLLNV